MGKTVSKIRGSFFTRPAQRFNIDTRTEKLLKKDEPRPAPKYQSDAELLQSIRQDRPDLADAAIKKDSQLLTKLESIYVTSEDPEHFDIETDNNRKRYINPDRPMPEKGVQSTFGAGFQEAATLLTPVKGKLQLDDVNFILSQYKINPSYETLMDISDKNGLDSKKLSNVFQYVKIFRLHEGSKLAAEEEQKNQIQAKTTVGELVSSKFKGTEAAEDNDEDPYRPKNSWIPVEESKILQDYNSAKKAGKALPYPSTQKQLPDS